MGKRINTAVWIENENRWRIQVQKNGERKNFYSSKSGRTGQREANAKADAWLDSDLTNQDSKGLTAFNEFLSRKKTTTSESNFRQIKSFGEAHILPVIGKKKIDSLTEDDLQKIIDLAYSKGLSRKTLQGIRATLLSFIKFCRSKKITTLNPESLSIPKGATISTKTILQPEHLKILFSSTTTELYGKSCFDSYVYAYRFHILTGLRPGELIGLYWTDIVKNEIHIKRSVNRLGRTTHGKNDNAIRSFVLNKTAMEVLADQKGISATYPDGPVFEIVTQENYRRRWDKYCKVNGIPHTTPYELRHTFVSIAKDLSEGRVKSLVGHSKNMDTFGVYGHTVRGEMEETAELLDEIFHKVI